MKNNSIFIFLALFLGCTSPDATSPKDPGYRYFPLETGRYVEYEVQEITYRVSGSPLRANYYLKEVCGPSMPGDGGQTQFQIKRFRRNTLQQAWAIDSVWTAYLLPDRAVKIENNIAFLKIIFPVAEGTTWNGNLLNTQHPVEYEARFAEAPVTYGKLAFPAALDIIQQYDSSIVSLVKHTERYAADVGLISKESTTIDYCQDEPCIGKGIIESGRQKTLKIMAYGKE